MLPPFSLAEVVTRWQFAPIITAFAVIAAGLYLWGVLRVRRRHPARPWPLYRTALFLGGLAVVVIATQSGIGSYDDVLFWDHMVQHLLLLMVAPPLLVVGQPATLLLHASRNPLHTWSKKVLRSRVLAAITWPPFGVALYVGVIVGTHLTGFMNLVETNSGIHDAEHALYLIAGYLYFLPLSGGSRSGGGSPTRPGSSCCSSPCRWTRSLGSCSALRAGTRSPGSPTAALAGHRARSATCTSAAR